jgi:hypothetical protein
MACASAPQCRPTRLVIEVLCHLLNDAEKVVDLDASRRQRVSVEPFVVEHHSSEDICDGFGLIVGDDLAASDPLSCIEYVRRRSGEDIVHQSDLGE